MEDVKRGPGRPRIHPNDGTPSSTHSERIRRARQAEQRRLALAVAELGNAHPGNLVRAVCRAVEKAAEQGDGQASHIVKSFENEKSISREAQIMLGLYKWYSEGDLGKALRFWDSICPESDRE